MKTLDNLINEHLEFTSATFPLGTAKGALLHAQREVKEVLEEMDTPTTIEHLAEEFADVLGCVFDSANRSGVPFAAIIEAFGKKLTKNKARTWKYNGDGSYCHIKPQII